ncbi:MAG TPA: DUF1810 domain-containing protein [Candidatus Angelobacter sp.]|nr:DUF1810 domain-containing protein [Candidatus Angelobacter sp.]
MSVISSNDPYDLERFIGVQARWIDLACKELREGRKQSHWMWFIFPQLKGLGHSAMANLYGISSQREAEAYLEHPILGMRLRQCTSLVIQVDGKSVEQIFDDPDDMKFHSSMTLFASVDQQSDLFKNALKKYFVGKPDQKTLERLGLSHL